MTSDTDDPSATTTTRRVARRRGDGDRDEDGDGYRMVVTPETLRGVVASARRYDVLAFDTEFSPEKRKRPELSLVQIAWPRGVALIDAFAVDVAKLTPLFGDRHLAVFHAAEADLSVLTTACGAVPVRVFDTQLAARFIGHGTRSLASLVETFLGRHLDKHSTLEDWSRRPLPTQALHYAAEDVASLVDLYEILTRELRQRGRLQWALDECEQVYGRRRTAKDEREAWWQYAAKLPKRGKARHVAQALATWRERRAHEFNVPSNQVIPELGLLAVALGQPLTPEELRGVRGIHGGHLRKGMDREILACVSAGRSMTDDELHEPPRQPRPPSRPVVLLLSAWLSQAARELDIDSTLLATRDDVEAFASGRESRLRSGWRLEVVGDQLDRLLSGRARLVVDGSRLQLVT